jgi:hypothetical protein
VSAEAAECPAKPTQAHRKPAAERSCSRADSETHLQQLAPLGRAAPVVE